MASGDSAPPTLPHIFMAPDTVPAFLPPISIADDHAPGITRSLKKLAKAIQIIAFTPLFTVVEYTRNPQAPVNPIAATTRRMTVTLCTRRNTSRPSAIPAGFPSPPKNNGKPASHAATDTFMPRPSRKYVGSQVMKKYQPQLRQKY